MPTEKYAIRLSPEDRRVCERIVVGEPFRTRVHRNARIFLYLDRSVPGHLSVKRTAELCRLPRIDVYQMLRVYLADGLDVALLF